ncbi:MAG: CZB domain-containing protein [Nitrosomonas sp.]|nr:CZB domain-containing protein [Nitrosomonas sp.]
MDLNQAIEKHAEWKVKFRSAIVKKESMDAGTISKDNCCELGKWLHGIGRAKFSNLPSFKNCVLNHVRFHIEAGKIAQAINLKKYTEAETMLSNGTPYSLASNEVGTAIIQLKKEAQI